MSRVTSGPRQMTGVCSSSTRNCEEIIGMPPRETEGSIPSPLSTRGPLWPNSFGIDGPVMSASRRPTESPRRRSSDARSAVAVDFPTPPLPLPTATTWWILPLLIRWSTPRLGPRAVPGGELGEETGEEPAGALFIDIVNFQRQARYITADLSEPRREVH